MTRDDAIRAARMILGDSLDEGIIDTVKLVIDTPLGNKDKLRLEKQGFSETRVRAGMKEGKKWRSAIWRNEKTGVRVKECGKSTSVTLEVPRVFSGKNNLDVNAVPQNALRDIIRNATTRLLPGLTRRGIKKFRVTRIDLTRNCPLGKDGEDIFSWFSTAYWERARSSAVAGLNEKNNGKMKASDNAGREQVTFGRYTGGARLRVIFYNKHRKMRFDNWRDHHYVNPAPPGLYRLELSFIQSSKVMELTQFLPPGNDIYVESEGQSVSCKLDYPSLHVAFLDALLGFHPRPIRSVVSRMKKIHAKKGVLKKVTVKKEATRRAAIREIKNGAIFKVAKAAYPSLGKS
jgi:hypothetical protein